MIRMIEQINSSIGPIGRLDDQLVGLDGKFVGLAETIEIMKEAGISAADAYKIFDRRAGKVGQQLIDLPKGELAEFTKLLEDSLGTAAETAAIKLDTLQGRATILIAATNALGVSVGRHLNPTIDALIESLLIPAVNQVEKLSKSLWGAGFAVAYFGKTIESFMNSPAGMIVWEKLLREIQQKVDMMSLALGMASMKVEQLGAAFQGGSPVFDKLLVDMAMGRVAATDMAGSMEGLNQKMGDSATVMLNFDGVLEQLAIETTDALINKSELLTSVMHRLDGELRAGRITAERYRALKGIFNDVGETLEEAGVEVKGFVKELDDGSGSFQDFWDGLDIKTPDEWKARVAFLEESLEQLYDMLDKGLPVEAFMDGKKALTELVREVQEAGQTVTGFSDALSFNELLAKLNIKTFHELADETDFLAQAFALFQQLVSEDLDPEEYKRLREEMEKLAEGTEGTVRAIEGLSKTKFEGMLGEQGIKTTKELIKESEALSETIRMLNAEFADGRMTEERYLALIEQLDEAAFAIEDLGVKVAAFNRDAALMLVTSADAVYMMVELGAEGMQAALVKAHETVEGLGESIQRSLREWGVDSAFAFGDALVEAAFEGKDAFKKFFKQLMMDLARAILQALILNAILGIASGGTSIAANQAASAASGASSMANTTGMLPAFAGGGIASGPSGIDQITARLSKGEGVLTVGETKKVLGGQAAIVPLGGASVGSTNFGDLNFFFQGSMTSEQARELLVDDPMLLLDALAEAGRRGIL